MLSRRAHTPVTRAHGFTLIELLAVVAILSIVAAAGVTIAAGAFRSQEVALTRRKIKAVSRAALAYHRDTRAAPPELPVAAGDPDGLLWASEVARPPGWRGPYLEATEQGAPLEDAWRRPIRLRVDPTGTSAYVWSSGPDGVDSLHAPGSDDIWEFISITAANLIQYQDLFEGSASELTQINGAIRRFNRDAVMSSAQRPFHWTFVHRQVDQDGVLVLSPLVIVNPESRPLADEWRELVDILAASGHLVGPAADSYTDGNGRPYVPVGYGNPANYIAYPHYGPDPRLVVVEVRLEPPPTP